MVFPGVITIALRRKALNPWLVGCLWAFAAYGQSPTKPTTLTYADFAHAHKGCPENSECGPEMGRLLQEWTARTERWRSPTVPTAQKLKEIREQLRTQGWPVEFFTKPAAQNGFAPVQFNSSCSHHNPKDNVGKITRGQAFIKGLEKDHVVVSRGDTEYKVRLGDLMALQPVDIHREDSATVRYYLPLDERPAFLEKGRLQVLAEANELYVVLSIGVDGPWEVSLPPERSLAPYFEERQEIACPKDAPTPLAPWFQRTYCQKLWDKEAKKTVIAQFYWACP